MKKLFLKITAPIVAFVLWWIDAVDTDEHDFNKTVNEIMAEDQPDPLYMRGFDAGIPTG